MSIVKLTRMFLFIVLVLANRSLAEPVKSYEDSALKLKLESSVDVELQITTEDFGFDFVDQVCEFSGKGKDTGVAGALVHSTERYSLKEFADSMIGQYTRMMAAKSELVSEQKLDRQPGEWILREYKVEEFGSIMRHFHVIVKDGRDNYALVVVSPDNPKAKQIVESITATLTVAGVPGPGAGQKGFGDGGKKAGVAGIVFSGNTEREIYLLKDGEQKPINITNSPGWDYQPAFSRDGSKIVFISCRNADNKARRDPSGIYTMNADGSDVKWIVKDDHVRYPRWSPDGSKIVYSTLHKFDINRQNWAICTVNADGTDVKPITAPGADYESADWSPDGSRIVFTGNWVDNGTGGLYTMNPDGSDRRQILTTFRLAGIPRHPKWSPDGKQIIFTGREWQETPHANEDYYAWGATMTINADGTNLQFNHATHDSQPVFMPKMNKIMFIAMHGGDYITSGNKQDLFIKNLNGVQTLNISKDFGGAHDFDVSPLTFGEPLVHAPVPNDIVFSRWSSGGPIGSATSPSSDLFVISEDGKKFANITQTCTFYAREDHACWSPDKKKIVFESNQPYWVDGENKMRSDGIVNIWICDADGSNRVNLTKFNGEETYPRWSPDGTQIMFQRGVVGGKALFALTLATGEITQMKPQGWATVYLNQMTWSNDGATFVISGNNNSDPMKAISLTTDPMVSEKIDKGSSLDPDWNPTSDMIAYFGWNAKNNYGLLRFDFPGGASEQVVEFPRGRHPSWAPDGYRIVFDTDPNAGDSQLLIADIRKPDIKDTINITKDLLGKNYAPDWGACPDPHAKKPPMIARSSNYLVVSCKSGDDYILYSIKSDGTEMKEVGKFKGPLESAPKFSSNGKRAAAYANRNGKFEVFVSDLDGKEARSIGQGDSPLLSPDGSKVAYIKGDQFPVVTILDLTNPNAQPIPRSGGQPHRSGDSPWIGWSPDGKKVIFHSDLSGLTSVAPSLFSINADGSNCTKLIDIDGMGTGAAYSEDGKSIAYQISHPGGSSTYYMIPSNGGTAKMLFDGNVSMPQNWTTPDGSRVFVSKDNALFSMNLDGSDAKQIASGSLAFYWWKENGKNAGVIALDESRNNKLVLYNNDGTNPRWLDKLKNVGSFEWCDDGSNVEKKDEVVAAKGDFVLKDGTYKIKTTWGDLDPKSGWSVNSGVIKRSYETKVGWGDEAKPVTYSGQLAFTGPPPTLKPGQTFELSLSASGDYQTSMMGEWFIGSGKKEGDEAVAISQPGATNPWPTSGKLKVTFGEVVGDRYEVMLTVEKFLTVSWVYERK